MKNSISICIKVACTTWVMFILACNHSGSKKTDTFSGVIKTQSKIITKPISSYPDTLIIKFPAAVFFHPDSLQLLKIKAQTDSMVFEGSIHEFFYQMRNARMVIKETLPGLSIIESKNYRYILFIKKDNTGEYIDLNTKNDAYGLLVFNGKKSPLFVDMTNIETAISFYFKE